MLSILTKNVFAWDDDDEVLSRKARGKIDG
jgi:hypothetical protein